MKIIKRTDAGDLVIFAGPNLTLNGQTATGNGWSYTAPGSWVMVLEDGVTLPEGYISSGWTYTNGVWTINALGAAEAFPGLRATKIQYLLDSASEANYASVTYNAVEWPTDEITRDAMAQVLSVGSVPEGMYWRDVDDVAHDVTYADLQAIGFMIVERGLVIDTNLDNKIEAVYAANSVAAINAVVWE